MDVFFGLIVIVLGSAVLCAAPTMFLWDWLMPQLFGLHEITLLQALGLNILCGLLFRSSCTCKGGSQGT